MNKQTLRSLGIGFLASGILTGAFAIFGQGNAPVEGMQVNTLFDGSQNNADVESQREEMSSLLTERDSLESTRNNLNESIASLTEENEAQASQLESLQGSASSQPSDESNADETDEPTSDEAAEEPTDDTTESEETASAPEDEGETTTAEPETASSFTVNSGESSSEIAQRLEDEGFVASAGEFQALIDEWDLSTVIAAGDYDLNSDMSIHDIASIITQGAYYYY